jgi:ABC-type antimicrobial peptide transport system permease subunit
VLRQIDAGVPAYRIRTGEELIQRTISARQYGTWLVSAFAAVALALGLIGVHAVVSHILAASRREIGLRMALGATRVDMARLLLARGFAPVAAGLVVGLAIAAYATRALSALLFDVSPLDAWVFALVPAAAAATTMLACAIPARRALRVDPAVTIRDVW